MVIMSETVLKAARLAYPEFIWRDEDGMILGASRKTIEALGDSIRYMAPEQVAPYFNAKFSIDSGNCGMALQIALEDEDNGGWVFFKRDGLFSACKGIFSAFYDECQINDPISAPTKPALLLKCTEAL
jgi:hypothetical protein